MCAQPFGWLTFVEVGKRILLPGAEVQKPGGRSVGKGPRACSRPVPWIRCGGGGGLIVSMAAVRARLRVILEHVSAGLVAPERPLPVLAILLQQGLEAGVVAEGVPPRVQPQQRHGDSTRNREEVLELSDRIIQLAQR